MSAELLKRAAGALREKVGKATPGPWHEGVDPTGHNRYAALVSDVPGEGRPTGGGWGFDSEYGGYLTGESLLAGDRAYIATMHPGVALALADWLDHEVRACALVRIDPTPRSVAVALAILGEQP